MKFIPKKQTGGLVNRYLQANQYSLNKQAAPNMIEAPIPYFTPAQTEAHLASQAREQAAYNRSVTPVNVSGPTVVGRDGSYNHVPTMNVAQRPLVARPSAVVAGPTVTPGSVSGINDLIDLWKTGQTSQTAPVATEPKWRMPIQGQVPAGTVDKMKQEREAAATKPKPTLQPKPTTKKPATKPVTKSTTKSEIPSDTKRVGIGKNEKYVQKPEAINTGTSKKVSDKKPGTVDGGLIGHAINQAMPGTTNKSSYRYPKVIEAVGKAAAGNPTPGAAIAKSVNVPNEIIGSLLHWLSPTTTNAPKK